MYYNNKNYEKTWQDISWDSDFNNHCQKILKHLAKKDLLFLQSYYWLGLTEEKIAPLLGFSSKSSVSEFKNRVFAKIRMYTYLSFVKLPNCLQKDIKKNNLEIYDLFKKISLENNIKKLENAGLQKLISESIKNLINYFQNKLITCNSCNKNCIKTNNNFLLKILNISDNSILTHIQIQIKLLKYLIDWREFDEND